MSEFKVSCPKCDQHIACDESHRGAQFPCPTCGTTITIPANPGASVPVGRITEDVVPAKHPRQEARPRIPPRPRVHSGPRSKSWLTTFLLAFFLGGLGIDRFYNGRMGLGIGKLLTGGACGLWSFIDVFLLLFKKYQDAQGNTLQPAKSSHMVTALSIVGAVILLNVVVVGSVVQGVKSEFASMDSMGASAPIGFASPEDVFEHMKSDEEDSWELSFYPPEEQPLVAYAHVLMARAMSMFAMEEDNKKESEEAFTDLIEKYDLADRLEFTDNEDKWYEYADRAFAGVDLNAFFKDVNALLYGSHSPYSEGEEEASLVSMQDLTIEGDEATATLGYADGTDEEVVFVKSSAGWFLSFEKSFMNPEEETGPTSGETYERSGNTLMDSSGHGNNAQIHGDTRDSLNVSVTTLEQWNRLPGKIVSVASDPRVKCQTGIILAGNDRYQIYPCPSDRWNTSPKRWQDVDYRGHLQQDKTSTGRPFMQLCYQVGNTDLKPVIMGQIVTGRGGLHLVPSDLQDRDGDPRNNTGSIRVKVVAID
jgi:TM2 domain-containing membrane protein YozV